MSAAARKRRLVLVTPELARQWLGMSRGNRRISKASVSLLRNEIRLQRWVSDLGDPIAFDVDGRLVNGHHRLTAILQEGVAVSCVVEDDMPEAVIQRLDQIGLIRIGADVMTMAHGDSEAYRRAPILGAILTQTTAVNKLTPEAYRIILAAIGPERVDLVARVQRQGRGSVLRAAFAYCMPALGAKASPIWDDLMAAELPPRASTMYKILGLAQNGPHAVRRDTFARAVSGFRLLARGQDAAGKLYAAEGAMVWADAAREITIADLSKMIRGAA